MMSPKLDRTFSMFEAVERGLRECISLTQADISSLKSSIDDGVTSSCSQQYKAAERYLKRLEYQLSKLEELKDQHDLHRKMRDGVRSMGYAYALSPGRERESALSSIKIGYKECTVNLKKIEAEFEACIGTIMIEMKGIQGFARICPGDVFEITLKYGEQQKWKTRGKILKDGKQQWENQQVVFKALLDEVLAIKAVEVRGLGKNVTLGNKLCETRNLFSAHPQLMTINLNSIGTLKLNLIVTWNPLHGVTGDSTLKSQILSRSSTSLFGSMRSLPALFSGSSLSGRLRSGTLPSHRSNDIMFDPHTNSSYFRSQMKKSHSASAGVTIKSNSDSTSSGSTSSSLHLTGTSSGFGSGSSYSGSTSVPCSALTSPDTESAPIILANGRHTTGHLRPSRMFLSASVSNLNRADSALLNKRPRPISQINEYNNVNQIHLHNGRSSVSRRVFDRSYQDIIEAADENNTDCSSDLTDSSPAKSTATRRSSDGDLLDESLYVMDQSDRHASDSYPPSGRIDLNQGALSLSRPSTSCHAYVNLSDCLINLISSLEDIQGQYTETQSLQQNVHSLFKVIKSMTVYHKQTNFNNNNNPMDHCSSSFAKNNSANSKNFTPVRSMFGIRSRRGSGTSDYSFAIESALQSFDFLNTVTSDMDSPARTPEHCADRLKSKSTDQISFQHQHHHHNQRQQKVDYEREAFEAATSFMTGDQSSMTPSPSLTPHPFTTGSEQLDLTIMSHLSYCQKLLENLGAFGPLRQRELASLQSLSRQGTVIGKLHRLCLHLRDLMRDSASLSLTQEDDILQLQALNVRYQQQQDRELLFLREDVRTRKIWDLVTYQHAAVSDSQDDVGSHLICVTSRQFAETMVIYLNSCHLTPVSPSSLMDSLSRSSPSSRSGTLSRKAAAAADLLRSRVAKLMTNRIIDSQRYEPDFVVTVFQVNLFFQQESQNLEQLLKGYSDEVLLQDSLGSGDAIEVKQALNRLRKSLPPRQPLFQISLLLLDKDPLIVRIAETFFLESSKSKHMRHSLIEHFLEGLAADSSMIRQAACIVLMLLSASETMDQLLYISYADTNAGVREQAKHTLFSLGDSGRKLYESSQLFAHGFRGLAVKSA